METPLALAARYYRLFPTMDAPLGHAEEELALAPEETAFLIVDVYGRDLEEQPLAGANDLPGIYRADPVDREIVLDRIRPAKAAAKAAGLPVVYLTNKLMPGTNERTEWRNCALRTTSVDVLTAWQEPNDILVFSSTIAPEADDHLIPKQMYSGFFETTLDSTLRGLGVRNLVVAGFDARICLGNTVTDAVYRGYRVIVLRDATRTFEYPETREGGWANFIAIRYIETNVGYTTTAADFVEACSRARP
jgi:ureidoacrylate peracid hydrolase